jgi:aspartyl-tRNA synthetase
MAAKDYEHSLNRLTYYNTAAATVGANSPFGTLPMIQSTQYVDRSKYVTVKDLNASLVDKVVTLRARVSTTRAKGKLAFLVLRHTIHTVQCVFSVGDVVTKEFINFVGKLNIESVVEVSGKVIKSKVESTTQSDVEIQAERLVVVSDSQPVLPFQLSDASQREGSDIVVNQDTRLDCRWLDMRTPANNAIFTLQSKMTQFFREYLISNFGFVEIHTPKIIGTASEGGCQVFKMDYFGKPAFLAQSPQLYKQMALQGDLEGVFEVAPVFRAENANTYRHLTEFMGLDVEMVIYHHYYEVLDLAEGLFHSIFSRVQTECAAFVEAVNQQYPHAKLVYQMSDAKIKELGIGIIEENVNSTDPYGALVRNRKIRSLRMNFQRAIALLNSTLPKDQQVSDVEDINTTNEKLLGGIIRERYGVDFYIIDKYPATVRPFYTMPSADDPTWSNSYDMFLRGEEISSGAQRVHDAIKLMARAKELNVDLTPIMDYVNSFKLGAWPHGGFGVGLERLVMLFLGMKNIRCASMFPRDPRRVTP